MASAILGKSAIQVMEEGGFTIEQVVLGEAPFPLSTFESFARGEFAGENVDFVREVAAFKTLFEKYSEPAFLDEATQEEILEAFQHIIGNYIASGSVSEVNLSGTARKIIMDWSDKTARDNIVQAKEAFNAGQQEILGLLATDTYPRFLNLLRSRNLTDTLAKEALQLGRTLFLLGLGIHGIAYFINSIASLQPSTSRGWEVMGNRLWRLFGFPFVYQGMGFIAAGRTRLCSLCSAAQVHHAFDDRDITYWEIVYYETLAKWNCAADKTDNNQYKSTVDDIIAANAKRSFRQNVITLLLSLLIAVAILLLPPNEPEWF